MKQKQVLALALASAMVFSLATGQVAFAAQDGESVVSEITQDANNGTEGTEDQVSEDQAKDQDEEDADGEVTEKGETEETSKQKDADADKQDAETQSEDVEAQADDPVIDSSAKTVTYNEPIDITLDANSSQSQGYIYALEKPNNTPSGRNVTYIYNAPIHITFDGVTADWATVLPTNKSGSFNTYQFNAPITVDIKNNCNIQQFAPWAVVYSVSALFGDEKEIGIYMNDSLTINIANSTVATVAGGIIKNGSFDGSGWPPVKINTNCKMDGNVDINISNKSDVKAVYAGHLFTANDTKESNNQTFTMKSVNITVDDSTVGGIVSSRLEKGSASDRANDAKIDGDLNITLKNGAKLTSSLIANKCIYGANDAYQSGEVTGTTTFTTDGDQTMAQLRNVDQLNLGGALNIIPASESTGARMTLKDTGMKIDLTNPDQWKTGDTVLSYKYTDGTYPKVDENQVASSWSDASMSLVYGDDTAESTQNWTFKRDTVDISIKEKDGSTDYGTITIPKNDRISWDQIPEEVKKPGYEISGWEKEDGSTWDLDKDAVTDDMTIHPVWKLENPDVALETEGKVTEVHAGQGLKLTATATHDGPEDLVYTFVWYKDGEEIKDLEAANEVSTQASEDSSSMIVKEAGEYSVKVTVTDGVQTSDEVDCGPIAITVSDHKFDGDWEKDETDHWHVCTVDGCDVKGDEAEHTFGEWKITKEATATEAGSKESVCDVCGYKKTEVIPATGDSKDDNKDDGKKDPSKPGDNSGNQNNGNANNGNKNNGSGTNVQTKKAAKTGDTTGLGLAVAGMAVAAGAGVSAVAVKKRKK